MSISIKQRVENARAGKNPTVICRLPSGWVVLGDVQFLKGYCLLLADPVVENLNSLRGRERDQFLKDMGLLGDALLAVTKAARINYEMLGNLDLYLHAHLFPRYNDEVETLKTKPAWFYDWQNAEAFNPEKHAPLMMEIKRELSRITKIQ